MKTKTCENSCLDCVFHTAPAELGGLIHLCILPPDCAPPAIRDEDDYWRDREVEGRTYLGTSCDVMRRMGAGCGPRAALWCSTTSAVSPATSAAAGNKA